MKLGDIDLTDVHVFEQGVPHDYFAFLRKEHPVSWTPRANGTGFWSVVSYQDIAQVEANVALFSSRTNITPTEVPEQTLAATIDRMIILSDPPRHGALRKLIMSGFTPKAISKIEEHIRQLAVDSIDAVIEEGACDFHDLGAHMPIEIVADLLGVPAEDRQNLFNWANAMFGGGDPRISSHAGMERARQEMFGYAMRLAQQRRAQPADDVFSQIAMAEMDGEKLTEFDLGCFFLILATAGNETTRTQILHGTHLLIENPEAMRLLRSDLSLLPNAVEEMLRMTSPALAFARKATQDYELRGQTIRAGDQVVMWYCSGSRDETVFSDPDIFDIRRKNAREHMAFGSKTGIHRCLGAMLARSELLAIIKEVVLRLPDIQLDGAIERLRSNFTNGINHMPVRFTPGKAHRQQKIAFYAANADKTYAHG